MNIIKIINSVNNAGSPGISYKGPMKWDLAGIGGTIILFFK